MKNKLIFLILHIYFFSYSQYSFEYNNLDLYKGKAIVFTREYNSPIKLPENVIMFTPTEEDIIHAEEIFVKRFNSDIAWTVKKYKNIKRKYYKYNRQYLGYINQIGERYIIINLLNFRCKKKAKDYFEGWLDYYFVGNGAYYEKNTISLVANLNTKRLELY